MSVGAIIEAFQVEVMVRFTLVSETSVFLVIDAVLLDMKEENKYLLVQR